MNKEKGEKILTENCAEPHEATVANTSQQESNEKAVADPLAEDEGPVARPFTEQLIQFTEEKTVEKLFKEAGNAPFVKVEIPEDFVLSKPDIFEILKSARYVDGINRSSRQKWTHRGDHRRKTDAIHTLLL